jgi:hypothetical protein
MVLFVVRIPDPGFHQDIGTGIRYWDLQRCSADNKNKNKQKTTKKVNQISRSKEMVLFVVRIPDPGYHQDIGTRIRYRELQRCSAAEIV